ncbi:MAG: cobalamin-independent methionine synthase II family protein [Proteobacteria bacterium]|nr:cobalamin-independent methionine synthase II family protein [Pseudomonadota bacterium]
MRRSENRILTTHTGSLPRPPELTERYVRRDRGEKVDAAEIAAMGRAAVRWAVRKQIEVGIDVGNDGEQKRDAFFLHLRQRLSGLGGTWERPPRSDVERYPVFKQMRARMMGAMTVVGVQSHLPKAIGEIRHTDPNSVHDECVDFLEAIAQSGGNFVEPFITAPSPGILATAIRNEYYDSDDAYIVALGKALQVEYEAIASHGLVLQLDCPDLGLERHLFFGDKPLSVFLDFVEKVVDAINNAIRNVPREQVRMHVCWGNSESPHDSDVPLDDTLPILRKANVGAFVLPFANSRHAHEFRCFKKFPLASDQILVAGVIDTLTNVVEHPEVVADRLERVAEVVGDPRRVMAGTDCGFDTAAGLGRVAEDVVWAKLASLVEGARLASGRLFAK